MRPVKYHNGNYAIDVKFPKSPDDVPESVFSDNQEIVSELIADWLTNLEAELQRRYSTYGIKLEWTGRSGGWFEITGDWSLSEYPRGEYALECDNRKRRIIERWIIPAFQEGVDVMMKSYYDFWEDAKKTA